LELGTENKIIQEGATGKIEQIKGMLVYQMQDSVQEEQYNTLEVPNSGEFQLVLSDGTQVWLNAGTKLTYPIAFVKGERKVYLEGEAYFEVAKNEKKPFIVHANGMDIRVLGTSFNLKSFVEDKQSVVTLLSGRVEVKTSSKRVVLQPEQQAEFRVDKNQLIVQKADLKSVLAWKNDMFIFKDASLEYMMKELGRWFDVEVEFESEELKALRVYIYIERSKTLKDVLDKITSIDGLKWRIEKKKIILESDKN
jgi:ferric-dicitrate binding protein FerR (iron transport regulator)